MSDIYRIIDNESLSQGKKGEFTARNIECRENRFLVHDKQNGQLGHGENSCFFSAFEDEGKSR